MTKLDEKYMPEGWHTHMNKDTLDKITESGGLPQWDGGAWSGGADITTSTVTIAPGDWSGTTATKTVTGMTTTALVWVAPAPTSYDDYANAEIRATAQASNQITFGCAIAPTASITVNVAWTEAT